MSEIDNNPAGAGSPEGNAAQQQNPIADPYSMFNDPVNVMDFEEDDEIPISGNLWSSEEPENLEGSQSPTDAPAGGAVDESEAAEALVFDDPIIEKEQASAEKKSDDDLKAELEKRGFKVDKVEDVDVNVQRTQELSRINTLISDAKNFLSLPPQKMVEEKVRAELARQYISSGRQGLIGNEEFQIELESELEQYTGNPALLNIYANNVKTEVQNVIQQNEGKANQITSEIDTEVKEKLIKSRAGIQNGLTAIHGSGIFGIKPTSEETKEIYNSIISGEFSKTVNSDPNLVAEFATYRKFREQIHSKLGGPTYGEGVKAAAETINGGPLKSESSLATVVKNTANGVTGISGQNDRKKSWSQQRVEIPTQNDGQKQVIAGSNGVGFL